MDKSLLEVVHDSAIGLYISGIINAKKLKRIVGKNLSKKEVPSKNKSLKSDYNDNRT